MSGEERRGKIIQALKNSDKAVSATTLAKEFDVSRQVIVQDVALLRANGKNIFSTNRGYLIQEDEETTRVFKVQHEDDEVEKELTTIVDLGGTVEDVFVYHKVYGVLRAEMNIKSRMDIRNYMEEIRSGKSSLLKNVTSGYHYHTVRAERVEILDMIQEELQKKGLLAKLQDYEPVDFWGQNIYNAVTVRAGEDGKAVRAARYDGFPQTAIGWPVTPEVLYWAPKFMQERYKKPFMITENGMASHDWVGVDGKVHDQARVDFMARYLGAYKRAAEDGVDLAGYFAWSVMDNFEWAYGYSQRFGLVYTDYNTQKRIWKDSAYFYKNIIETNGENL